MRKIIIPSFAELILLGIITLFLIVGSSDPIYREISRICIFVTIYYWAILVLFGLLMPYVKHGFNLAFDSDPKNNILGYPIAVSFESKGGFICNNPIVVKAKVLNTTTPEGGRQIYKTRQLFKENFIDFNIVWPSSKLLKRGRRVSLFGQPDVDGIELNVKKCSGKASIIFTSPGKRSCYFMYKTKIGVPVRTPLLKEEEVPNAFIHISPPETLYQIRIGNIMYCLSLIILSLLLWNILNGLWLSL